MADVEVLTIGEVLTVLLAEPGVPLGEASRFDLTYAGAESNVAVGLSRLGHRAGFVSRLGDDHQGRRVLRELRGERVDVDAVALDPDRPTGLLLRDTLPTGLSVGYRRTGSAATALTPGDLPMDTLRAAWLLHLTGITAAISASARETVVTAARAARDSGVTICFDPNVRVRLADPPTWRAIADELAALADVLLIGSDDAAALGVDDPFSWGHDHGATTVVLKDGSRGASESHDGRLWQQPAISVPVVDPVGAGDAFAAGWLSGWLRRLEPAQRLAEAAAVAACVVAARGDVPGLPDPDRRDRVLAGSEVVSR